ncbi:unnamed protein product [Ectocarpus sp. CCAP 1310/34]|nr:unnamed protein product [Ectocarpus sp. CCAP 1310/34]
MSTEASGTEASGTEASGCRFRLEYMYGHIKTGGVWHVVVYAEGRSYTAMQQQQAVDAVGYADADFASKAADRRSVSGGIVTCGGGAVSWFSRTQKCVTLSTTEAEYVALGDVVKEILFLRQIWRFMLPQVGMPCIPVFEDNQGAIQLAQNPISNSNSKHIDVRHHFLRELVERKEISVIHVPSPYQRADFLTKSLPKDAFESHRDFVMNLA